MRNPEAYRLFSNGPARLTLRAIGLVATFVWVLTVVDDYLYHTPYFWGQWCGGANLPQLGRDSCVFVYNYYYSLDAHVIDSGVVATVFLLASLACIGLLWLPRHGVRTTLVRTLLVVTPLEILAFEVGVYFLLNYWWTVHATEFLNGTPLTNEVVFWVSLVVLAGGVCATALDARSKTRHGSAELVNTNVGRDSGIQ